LKYWCWCVARWCWCVELTWCVDLLILMCSKFLHRTNTRATCVLLARTSSS
jgi:hypothetical protein